MLLFSKLTNKYLYLGICCKFAPQNIALCKNDVKLVAESWVIPIGPWYLLQFRLDRRNSLGTTYVSYHITISSGLGVARVLVTCGKLLLALVPVIWDILSAVNFASPEFQHVPSPSINLPTLISFDRGIFLHQYSALSLLFIKQNFQTYMFSLF